MLLLAFAKNRIIFGSYANTMYAFPRMVAACVDEGARRSAPSDSWSGEILCRTQHHARLPPRDTLTGPALRSLAPCHACRPVTCSPALAYIADSARYPATCISFVCVIHIKGYIAHYPERITSAS